MAVGCGDGSDSGLQGTIRIDASSSVYAFAKAAADDFHKANPGVDVAVSQHGVDRGFEELCAGEADIAGAGRPIAPSEKAACGQAGIGYDELQVADGGIAVVANPKLGISCLDKDQLARLWSRGSRVRHLGQLGNDSDSGQPLPGAEISLYAPPADSDTLAVFSEKIIGRPAAVRGDYIAGDRDTNADPIAGDDGAVGFIDFASYDGHADELGLVGVDAGSGCVSPSVETIQDGSYYLTQRLSMFPAKQALAANPALRRFTQYVASERDTIADEAGAVPLAPAH